MRAPRGALKDGRRRSLKVWAFEPKTGAFIPGYAVRVYAGSAEGTRPCWLFHPFGGVENFFVDEVWEVPPS